MVLSALSLHANIATFWSYILVYLNVKRLDHICIGSIKMYLLVLLCLQANERHMRTLAVDPTAMLDKRERKVKFISKNGMCKC